MQFLSHIPFKTQKTIPSGSDNRGTGFLLQAGMIRMTLAGAYNFTPLGLRVLRNIENVVRSEMNQIGSQEILMSSLGSKESWEITGRWNSVDVLFKLPAAEGREYVLNPTHEEIVVPLVGEFIQSYKDLDYSSVYQIQWKFRNEKRAKSGLLRGREFLMKDAYSFHRNQEELDAYFEIMHEAYNRIFRRLGLESTTHYTFASGGDFSKYSYEFQTELTIGEDEIFICNSCGQAHNKEIISPDSFICSVCGFSESTQKRASEIGNIFKLSSRFSKDFQVQYQKPDGSQEYCIMGCYGIGISRLMGVIAEKFSDENGLSWPDEIAPFSHIILVHGNYIDQARDLARYLETQGAQVLIDDRSLGFGQKATDADLFGIPSRVVISDKTISNGGYEFKNRNESHSSFISYHWE